MKYRAKYPILCLLLSLGIATCTPLPSANQVATITLSRDGNCFECPWYAFTIYNDGTVIFRGVSNVDSHGDRLGRIPQDSVHALVAAMLRANYFGFKNLYDERQFSDAETVTTSLKLGSREMEIVDHFGAPDSLRQIEAYIDTIAGTARWIGNTTNELPRDKQRTLSIRRDVDSLEMIDDEMLQKYESLRASGDLRSAYHLFYEERKLNRRITQAEDGFHPALEDSSILRDTTTAIDTSLSDPRTPSR